MHADLNAVDEDEFDRILDKQKKEQKRLKKQSPDNKSINRVN